MRRTPLSKPELREWLASAYVHPNANWFAPVFDVRRRSLFYLTSRQLLAVDEPNVAISPALDRVLTRFERRDPTLRVLRAMPDEDRVKLVMSFIVSCDPDTRERLTKRFAERTSIVFGWRPGSLESLVEDFAEDGSERPLTRAWREAIAEACRIPVSLTISAHGMGDRPVYAVSL